MVVASFSSSPVLALVPYQPMKTRINILELQRIVKEKNAVREEAFRRALDICHRRIRNAAEQRLYGCALSIPPYVAGMPIYPIAECVDFVVSSLQSNGFKVEGVSPPNVVFVSWAPPAPRSTPPAAGRTAPARIAAAAALPCRAATRVTPQLIGRGPASPLTSSLIVPSANKESARLLPTKKGKMVLDLSL